MAFLVRRSNDLLFVLTLIITGREASALTSCKQYADS